MTKFWTNFIVWDSSCSIQQQYHVLLTGTGWVREGLGIWLTGRMDHAYLLNTKNINSALCVKLLTSKTLFITGIQEMGVKFFVIFRVNIFIIWHTGFGTQT